MTKKDALKLYSPKIISFMEGKGFNFINLDDDSDDKIFLDFTLNNWLVPITAQMEYIFDLVDNTEKMYKIYISFNCFGGDHLEYYHDNTDGIIFESPKITVFDNYEVIINPEKLDLLPDLMFTFNAILKRNKEIARQIVDELPSQEYFEEYYSNFHNDYEYLEQFLKANGISEEELVSMYVRIDNIDRLPSTVTDIFLF